MRENKYDDPKFFEQYAAMDRSVKGLAGAGEWHTLERMLPDFAGKRVLDLGCGFGWHCIYAAEHGAAEVVGVDLSEKMLAQAKQRTRSDRVRYLHMPIEDCAFPDESFDAVISSLAFHYLADFGALCDRVSAWLAPGGSFVFSAEHPVFTAQGAQDWVRNGDTLLHWPVDRYFDEGAREAVFLGERVIKHHRTMTTYLSALLERGFTLTGFAEPQPAPELLDSVPGMRDELRRPMMFIVSARK